MTLTVTSPSEIDDSSTEMAPPQAMRGEGRLSTGGGATRSVSSTVTVVEVDVGVGTPDCDVHTALARASATTALNRRFRRALLMVVENDTARPDHEPGRFAELY